jgi:hypothetical protein
MGAAHIFPEPTDFERAAYPHPHAPLRYASARDECETEGCFRPKVSHRRFCRRCVEVRQSVRRGRP